MKPFLPAFLIIIPLHELVHALVTPRMGFTRETLIACWPARLLFRDERADSTRRHRQEQGWRSPALLTRLILRPVERSDRMRSTSRGFLQGRDALFYEVPSVP
jgi:hypothetical protein